MVERDRHHPSSSRGRWATSRATAPTTTPRPAGRGARPVAPAPLRGRDQVRLASGQRVATYVPDVPAGRGRSSPTPGRDGQRHPLIMCEYATRWATATGRSPSTGTPSSPRRAPGRLHLGVARPRAAAAPAGRDDAPRVRRRLRRRAQRRRRSASTGSRSPTARPSPRCWSTCTSRRRCGPRPVRRRSRGPRGPGHAREPRLSSATPAGCARPGRSTSDGAVVGTGDLPLPPIAPGATRGGRRPRPRSPCRRRRALADPPIRHRGGHRVGRCRLRDRLGAGPVDDEVGPGPATAAPHQGWTGDVALDDGGCLPPPRVRGAAGPVPVARADRQRRDRRDGRSMGDVGPGHADAAARRDRTGGRRRHRPRDLDDRGRDRDRAHAAALRGGRPDPRRGVGRRAGGASRTCRGSARCSSSSRVTRRSSGSAGPARDVSGPGAWRPRRAVASTVTDQLVPYVRPQENGGHSDTRWFRVGSPGVDAPASTSTRPARSRRRTRPPRTSTRRPTTSRSGRAPRPSSPRRRPPRGGDRELRPGHARTVRPSRPASTAGAGRWRRSRRVTIDWDAAAREWHLQNGRVSWSCAVLENGWIGHLHAGAPLRPAAPYGHLGPTRLRRATTTASASPWASRSRCRASATSGSRRWSWRARTARPCSTCGTPATGSAPRKPDLPELPSTYVESDDEAETLEVDLVDAPTGPVGHRADDAVRGSPGRRAVPDPRQRRRGAARDPVRDARRRSTSRTPTGTS